MAHFNQEILRSGGQRGFSQTESKVREESLDSEQDSEHGHNSRKGTKIFHQGEDRRVLFQGKANGSCSEGDSCRFSSFACFGKPRDLAEEVNNTGSRE